MEKFKLILGLVAALVIVAPVNGDAAEAFQKTFAKFAKNSEITVNHGTWDQLLATYVKKGRDGLNRVNYGAFKKNGGRQLGAYIAQLESVDPTKLNKSEQFAYWANLYNAKTVDVILEHYPVKSIKDIDISPGLFADGPWKKKLVTVKGHALSLDDIEHNILRVFWKDPRVHYSVNCASIGCPNLLTEAFSGATLEDDLEAAARDYINSPRGVSIKNGAVTVSKIYKWYAEDFGNSERQLLRHLRRYAEPRLLTSLKKVQGIDEYAYDWRLNE